MATKIEIDSKYGLSRLMPPSEAVRELPEAVRELPEEEAEQYEKFAKLRLQAYTEYKNDNDSGDID